MKKTPKKVTLQTVDKKLDTLITTVDVLAISTKHGFDEAAEFKKDMTEFAQKTSLTLFNIDSKLQTVDQRLDAIEKTLGPLVHVSNAVQRELREHNERIARIEHKIGLVTK